MAWKIYNNGLKKMKRDKLSLRKISVACKRNSHFYICIILISEYRRAIYQMITCQRVTGKVSSTGNASNQVDPSLSKLWKVEQQCNNNLIGLFLLKFLVSSVTYAYAHSIIVVVSTSLILKWCIEIDTHILRNIQTLSFSYTIFLLAQAEPKYERVLTIFNRQLSNWSWINSCKIARKRCNKVMRSEETRANELSILIASFQSQTTYFRFLPSSSLAPSFANCK